MAIKITLDSFLAVLKRSNLLSEEQVASALEKFRAAQPPAAVDAKPFAEFLVRNKILTVWQAEKVLQGKHKGFFLGRYRLLSLLGKGGMSSVYLAEHTVMKRRCALKVLPAKRVNDASYLGRFHREAQAVAALDHPNIVRAYDVDMTTDAGIDIHFLSMEFVQGKSLLELVQEKGPLPVRDAAEYIRQSADGLEHAHRAGLVHRDIKPGNLLLTSSGVLKILDLGLARFFNDEEASLTVQHDEKVLGTADYISPEQAIDSHKVDHRTDIYSLGCTLYFLLSGHPPFNSGSLAQRLVAHQTKPPPPLAAERGDVPASLIAIMDKMMAKKEADRFQSAQQVAEAMSAWLKQPVSASPINSVVAQSAPAATTAPAPVPSKMAGGKGSSVVRVKTTPPQVAPEVKAESDPLAFLSELSVDSPEPASPSGVSSSAKSSSKKLSQAAKETANLKQSHTEVVSQDPPLSPEDSAWEQAFDPALLHLDGPAEDASPELDFGIDSTSPGSSIVTSKTKTLNQVTAPSRKVNKRLLTSLLVAAIPILGTAAWVMWGEGKVPVETPPITQITPPPAVPASTRKPVTTDLAIIEVGPEGHFGTVTEALQYVRKNFQPLTDTDARTIQLKSGTTFSETIRIINSDSESFPRNVILKSDGAAAATIQGDGKSPTLHLKDVDSLVIEGVNIDGNSAPVAVQIEGYVPASRLSRVKILKFTSAGLQLEDCSGRDTQELVIDELRISANASEAVGIRIIQKAPKANVSRVQLRNSRIIGPLKSGIEISGFFWKTVVADTIISQCQTGIRFEGGLLDDITLVNDTFHKNDRAIAFSKLPADNSQNLKWQQLLFSGSKTADVLVESGEVAGLAEKLFGGPDGRRLNRTDRKDAATNELDLFAGDGQRGITLNMASSDPLNPDYLKAGADMNVPAPVAGAKGYVGAVAP